MSDHNVHTSITERICQPRPRNIPNFGTVLVRYPTLAQLRKALKDPTYTKEQHQLIYAWLLNRRHRGYAQ